MDNIKIIQATLWVKVSVNKGHCSIINRDNGRTDLIRDTGIAILWCGTALN